MSGRVTISLELDRYDEVLEEIGTLELKKNLIEIVMSEILGMSPSSQKQFSLGVCRECCAIHSNKRHTCLDS